MSGTIEKSPTRAQIEARARQLHLLRGSPKGDELADWLTAEKELKQVSNLQREPASTPLSDKQPGSGPDRKFLDFYGFREQPFGMTPDPAYLYGSRTHADALASLSRGIVDNRGFFALVAQPGMGKTTLLYQLLDDLRDSARTVLVSQTQCNSRELIEYILQELGVEAKGLGLVAMHGKLNEILFQALLEGKRFVLVVDEAQNLDDAVLETVRMLSNFETHNAKLLQIILAGQPRLALKLAQPRHMQLRQRVAVLAHLEPFGPKDTVLYIEHRLKVAGYHGEAIFDHVAIGAIVRLSEGIPRNINNLCHNSLQLAHASGQRQVTVEIVQKAARSLDLEALISEPLPEPISEPLSETPVVRAAAPAAVAAATPPKAAEPHFTPLAGPAAKPAKRAQAFLSYDAAKKKGAPNWRLRSAILAAIILSGILALAILGRSESMRSITPASFDRFSDALGASVHAARAAVGSPATYDADPQDTGSGQVITVAAGPQQSIKDLSMRYVGHFDNELFEQIRSLNPDLKDPDHLQAGQLIRIPLPSGALRKVNDTAEGDALGESGRGASGNMLARFSALLRGRK
jgi:type II secretory pathway predicted ATPase ExeA